MRGKEAFYHWPLTPPAPRLVVREGGSWIKATTQGRLELELKEELLINISWIFVESGAWYSLANNSGH